MAGRPVAVTAVGVLESSWVLLSSLATARWHRYGARVLVRPHLIPSFGRKQFAKLTGQDVRAFITRRRQECQCC